MRSCLIFLVCALMLSSCAPLPGVNTAVLPPGSGRLDTVGAIQYAVWAFANPARTRGDPASATRAVAALEHIAGRFTIGQTTSSMSMVALRLQRARQAVRRTLGIAPNVPSQAVVDRLIAVSADLDSGRQTAALRSLNSPIFTLGPARTLALLSNLPYVHAAKVASIEATVYSFNGKF
jgi:hypothetical protein